MGEQKEYKNKVMFARVSKEGNHIYMFEREGILGEGIKSLLINIADMENLLSGKYESIKVSAMTEASAEKSG